MRPSTSADLLRNMILRSLYRSSWRDPPQITPEHRKSLLEDVVPTEKMIQNLVAHSKWYTEIKFVNTHKPRERNSANKENIVMDDAQMIFTCRMRRMYNQFQIIRNRPPKAYDEVYILSAHALYPSNTRMFHRIPVDDQESSKPAQFPCRRSRTLHSSLYYPVAGEEPSTPAVIQLCCRCKSLARQYPTRNRLLRPVPPDPTTQQHQGGPTGDG